MHQPGADVVAVTVGGPELVVVGVVLFLTIIPIWAFIDAMRRPDWAFTNAGSNKMTWLLLLVVTTLVCNVGLFFGLYYLVFVVPRLKRQQDLGPGIGFPGR